jgi:hypothetical protein
MMNASEWAKKYADQAVNWLGLREAASDGNARKYFEGQFRYAILGVDPFEGSADAALWAERYGDMLKEAQRETRNWLAALPPGVRSAVPGGLVWWANDGADRIRPSRAATAEEIAWLRDTGALDECEATGNSTVRYPAGEVPTGRTDMALLLAMTEEEIDAGALADPDNP